MEKYSEKTLNTIISYLPKRIASAFENAVFAHPVEEIRLRCARQPQIVTSCGDMLLECGAFTREEAGELLAKLCRRSVYSREEELKRGFVTIEGGVRVGVCGRPVMEGGSIVRLTDITCFNFRIAREVIGCAESIMPQITEHGKPVSSLIVSPPGGGKTTLLRDMIRCLSSGIGCMPVKVGLADERGELAGVVDGAPSFDTGPRTDVMEFAPKAEAISMFVRSMSPDVIVTDEIGGADDAEAIADAARCGAAVIASAHASSARELNERSGLAEIVSTGVFRRILLLRRTGSMLHICPVKL